MKKLILLIGTAVILSSGTASAKEKTNDIFKEHGFNKAPLTLSKGEFNEFFTNEEVVQIGTILLNTKTNKIVAFLDEDTTMFSYQAESSSRWLSPDPLAEKYPSVSPYVYCENNPLKYIDPDGREKINALNPEKDKTIISGAQNYKDDNAIHIFAHGSSNGMTVVINGETSILRTSGQLESFLSKNSDIWQKKGEGDPVTLILHSCRTGQDKPDGSESFAEKISASEIFKDVTVIAPDQRVYFSEEGEVGTYKARNADSNGDYKRAENGEVKSKERSDNAGSWRVFENGNQTGSYSGDWKPKENPTLFDIFTKKEE